MQPFAFRGRLGLNSLLWAAFLACSPFVQAQRLLPFQGRLTDANSKPIPDGSKLVQFQIYSDSVGGSSLWAGELHRVTINGGLVNVMLGSKNPLPKDRADQPGKSFFDQPLYLQITVDANGDGQINANDPPLLPRQAILPVLFAGESALSRDSQKLGGYDWSPIFGTNGPSGKMDGTRIVNIPSSAISPGAIDIPNLAQRVVESLSPAGSITAYMGTNAPPGWLLCDGAMVGTNQYPALFSVIGFSSGSGTNASTFRLPDLRGLFLRGLDSLPDLAFPSSAVAAAAGTFAIPNHSINRSGYPLQITNSGGSLPGGLTATNTYYAIVVDANTIKLALTDANAHAGTAVALSSQGSGTNRLVSWVDPDKNTRASLALGGKAGKSIGSFQSDDLKTHTHPYTDEGLVASAGLSGGGSYNTRNNNKVTGVSGGNETRPKNVYVNYIIKY